MRSRALLVLITFLVAWSAPANAQLFSRKPSPPPVRTPPAQRIGELIVQAKSDRDERKRAAAAEELREFDTKTHPEIISVLADVARSDASAGVRQEALESLAKIRPVSILAGQTLERAAAGDDSWKVRWQAKAALLRYQLAGYHPPKDLPDADLAPKGKGPLTHEPPANPPQPPAKPGIASRIFPSRTNSQQPGAPKAGVPQASVPQAGVAQADVPQVGAPKAVGQPPHPVIVSQPPLPPVKLPANPVTPTPLPIIVDVPPSSNAPGPKAPEPKSPAPAQPANGGPQVKLPPAPPIAAPNSEVIEPNFRPAGQSPPRVPPPPPPAKKDDKGPALTVPM
ncbi:MAG: HEAT repeat domain-containing protein [Gemmataceae bacterium]|nr:HEAT repeat domain-containing protein [Gemmataceae bacterium]